MIEYWIITVYQTALDLFATKRKDIPFVISSN